MKKILLTGANGFVGQKILAAAKNFPDLSIIAASKQENKTPFRDIPFERFDITNRLQVLRCFDNHRPDIVLHTAALSLADVCENNPEECWKTNVVGTENLVEAAEFYSSRFIHLSTDFVFDGTRGPYSEDDIPNPLSMYGKSKHASEQSVMKSSISWAIVRTVLVYGLLPVMPRPNLVTFVLHNLSKSKPIKVVQDQVRTPTLAEDLAEGCLRIAEQQAEGIFHLSGEEMISVFEFSKLIAETFSLDTSLIEPVETASLQEPAKRPLKTGFVISKAKKTLAFRPHSLREGLALVKTQAGLYKP